MACGVFTLDAPLPCDVDADCAQSLFCDDGLCFASQSLGDDAGPLPTVSSVSPLSAVLHQTVTFSVEGENMTETLAFFVEECADVERTVMGPTQQEFTCTFSWFRGARAGVVKDRPGGEFLFEFWVQVERE
jgi:hypothetical protein